MKKTKASIYSGWTDSDFHCRSIPLISPNRNDPCNDFRKRKLIAKKSSLPQPLLTVFKIPLCAYDDETPTPVKLL